MSDATYQSWQTKLADRIPERMQEEIDTFENQMELRRQDKIEEKVFAELRLRRGAYGQRYDNGQRFDGYVTQDLNFPQKGLTKGPDTEWDAPGMQRIKIPFGRMTTEQLEMLADLAEEYSDNILHVTTRQDIQLHFVHIEDTPDMHRRLAAVGITTREACGNSVRNVTGCPFAGICRDETFDISPYAHAETYFLLGHRDVQDFGRKFKIAYSGCGKHACGLVTLHDLGFVAKTREVDGETQRGFQVIVGGGLGAVPHVGKELYEFMPEEQMLPVSQAISRVFARLGEKKNRNKARIKFLVAKLGIDEFRRLVEEELKVMEHDPAWQEWIEEARAMPPEEPKAEPVTDGRAKPVDPEAYKLWLQTNTYRQRQDGFYAIHINLPLGDITSVQSRHLADLLRRYTNDALRTTVEQNLLLRWVHEADLPAIYNDLHAIDLATDGAASIVDVTSCPGTDTCKLGISASRGLAGELRKRLATKGLQYDESLKGMRIKVSGCFNSCGQHHVADLGFFGSSRNVGQHRVPHFQVVLGGQWTENGGAYGKAIGAVPSKRIPETVDRLLDMYIQGREGNELFREWVARVGKKEIKGAIKDLTEVPDYDIDQSFYVDWSDAREYTIGDIGVGECAGEVVSLTDFSIAEAESLVFDASVMLEEEEGDHIPQEAGELAFEAMLSAAQGLIKTQDPDIKRDAKTIVEEFTKRFYDTKLIHDKYAGGKFAHYFFQAFESRDEPFSEDSAHRRVEEAQLFIEACYACHTRILANPELVTTVGQQQPSA